MSLVSHRPFGGLLSLSDEMNRLMANSPGRTTETGREYALFPAVNVVEDADRFTITAELPGLTADDVKVTLAENVLTVEGEKKEETEEKERNYHRIERSSGRFRRSFALPGGLQPDKVKAVTRDGVLTITAPKAEQAVAHEVKVESA